MRFVWVCVCVALTVAGCSIAPDDGTRVARQEVGAAHQGAPCREQVLAWGAEVGRVGMLPSGEERLARGAPAVAVAPDGDLFVLDAVNRRVLALDRAGHAQTFAEVPLDSEEIAIGPDGSVAVFSPLRSHVWVYGPDGAPAGEVAIPRALRNLTGISVSGSRRIEVHNAYQDTFAVGSPAVPMDTTAILRSKSEGAMLLEDGRGIKARATDSGAVEMIVVRNDRNDSEERHAQLALPLPLSADALQVVGVAGRAACFRAESIDRGATKVVVNRQLICSDTESGRTLFQSALPEPGAYVPRREIAVGGAPPTVAWQHPPADGLHIVTCEVMP